MASTDLIFGIFSPLCYGLFIDLDIGNFISSGCPATVISKLLGYIIIVGSFALKIPQILKIVAAKSGDGISVISLIVESLGFLVTTAYFYRQGYPASTFGESPIIFVQNMIILQMIFGYRQGVYSFAMGSVLVAVYCSLFAISMTDAVPMWIIQQIYASNILLILGARLPQIYSIYSAGSTGNNAFITWFLNFGGTLARLFTTLQEVDDMMALFIVMTSVVCNGIVVLQFVIYWNSDADKKKKKE